MCFFFLLCLFFYFSYGYAQLPYDSRNVSNSEWLCFSGFFASVYIDFTDDVQLDCGTEVLQNLTQIMPTISVKPSALDANRLYTVLIVDRDAPNANGPIRSPLIHMALGNLTSTVLATGINSGNLPPETIVWFPYSGPQPPAGSYCHRYFVQVYEQALNIVPTLNVTAIGRYQFDFPKWAASFNLTKVGLNYWNTQNEAVRVGNCDYRPSASKDNTALSIGLGVGIPAGLGVVAAFGLMYQRGYFGTRAISGFTDSMPGSSYQTLT